MAATLMFSRARYEEETMVLKTLDRMPFFFDTVFVTGKNRGGEDVYEIKLNPFSTNP
ncbi:hypothetical protein [Chitinophaga sp. 22620]|uniref:hypothetical protein n=1 Tax=Chitinophaga sp. 22620 TaxID=3453952 RepID=UPI003F8467DC